MFRRSSRCSYLLPENGLRLTTETLLLPVVTPTTLGLLRLLGLLVLRHLELLVPLAHGGRTERPTGLGHVHLGEKQNIFSFIQFHFYLQNCEI